MKYTVTYRTDKNKINEIQVFVATQIKINYL